MGLRRLSLLIASISVLSGCQQTMHELAKLAGRDTNSTISDDQPTAQESLLLTDPIINISSDTTPTFLISGVESGNAVRLYSDSACTNLVASGVAAATTISLTSSALPDGSYVFATTRDNSDGVFGTCSTTTVTYVVDSTPPVTVTFNKILDRFDEGAGANNMALTMSGTKPYDVVLNYTTSGTTATSGLIGGFSSGTVTIPAGQTTANIPVTIGSDTIGNSGERRAQANLTKTNSALVTFGALTHSRINIRDTDVASVSLASVSTGYTHSCGVSSTGKLYCWGQNDFSQVGNGSVVDTNKPVLIDAATDYSMVSAGYLSTCGITTGGVLKCWGAGYWGNIGDGFNTDRSTPVIVDSGISYKKVSASKEGHVCGITSADELKCWGANDDGQLGDGTSVSKNVPVHISAGTFFKDVSTGVRHTCAVTTANKIKCWGYNGEGRLGNGNSTASTSPIDIDAANDYKSVSLGAHHSCAIDSSDALKCWGNNDEGALGDGTTTSRNTPTTVPGGNTYASVSGGADFTCGVRISGVLECWGSGRYDLYGQIGDGSMERKLSPQTADAGITYTQVAAGSLNHTCGITTTGLAKCWGANHYGQLGDSTASNNSTPTLSLTDAVYSKISINYYHGCGIASNGALRCWGSNTDSLLGDGTTTARSAPIEIDPGVSYTKLAIGTYHSCAITSTGVLKCWGQNNVGQIDSGLGATVTTPVIVDTGVSYKEVAVGTNHSCGITSADVLKCWGGNNNGQLGTGDTIFPATIVVADSGTLYSKIGAGNRYSCGVTTAGAVKCWGSNWEGNLGDGTTNQNLTPTVTDAGTSYQNLSVGFQHVCGVTTTGETKCWGANYYGQLGDNSTTSRTSPVFANYGVATLVTEVSVGEEHTCAVTIAGALKCWGRGEFGRLGTVVSGDKLTPTDVDAGVTYSSVTAGLISTCGRTTAGTIKCWGSNLGGRFGDGVLNHYPTQVVAP